MSLLFHLRRLMIIVRYWTYSWQSCYFETEALTYIPWSSSIAYFLFSWSHFSGTFSVALLCYLEAGSITLVKEFTFFSHWFIPWEPSSHSPIQAIQVLLFGKVCFTIAHNSNTKKVISYKTSRNFLTPSSYESSTSLNSEWFPYFMKWVF